MKHVKYERKDSNKRAAALITSIITVCAAVIYILFGDKIAVFLGEHGLDYNKLSGVFTSGVTDGEMQVHIIDVGQGDSILVESKDGVILIDAGTNDSESALKAHLDACGVKTIDYFICTHPHEDHIGGADMVVNNYDVKMLLMSETDVSTATVNKLLDAVEKRQTPVEIPEVGGKYTLGNINFVVLAPDDSVNDNGNNASIVVRLTYGSTSFMFTGNAETESEKKILERFSVLELHSDFLKLGHHGSSTSTSEKFLEAVSPQYVAISCGKDNSYGHPHREILKRLADFGFSDSKILRTDKSGTIVVVSDGSTLKLAS